MLWWNVCMMDVAKQRCINERKVPGHYRLSCEHGPEEDGSRWWLHKGPITRAGPGTRKNDTLWCDVCARGRAVGLEQSFAIKTGHESGSREGGERGGKRASGGLMHSNLLACFQSGMRILEPRFRSLLHSVFFACGVNSQISRDVVCRYGQEYTGLRGAEMRWCRKWSFVITHMVPFRSSRDLKHPVKCNLSLILVELWNRKKNQSWNQKCASSRIYFVYVLWIQKTSLLPAAPQLIINFINDICWSYIAIDLQQQILKCILHYALSACIFNISYALVTWNLIVRFVDSCCMYVSIVIMTFYRWYLHKCIKSQTQLRNVHVHWVW